MNEVIMLLGDKPREILQSVIDENIPAAMSFSTGHKWQLVRVLLLDLQGNSFTVKITPRKKHRQIELEPRQSVGMSFKYGFGGGHDRFIFGTTVESIEQPKNAIETIKLAVPEEIEIIRAKSYLSVEVPRSLDIDVLLSHRSCTSGARVSQAWQGKLIDISAGGLRVSIDLSQGPDLVTGHQVAVKFTPLPHETPLTFSACINDFSQVLDGNGICFDLQIIGLEASPEGRMVLQRICSIMDQYLQMRQNITMTPSTQKLTM